MVCSLHYALFTPKMHSEKFMRSLKRKDNPILKGMQIYHNYIRSHMSLGTTLAEKRESRSMEKIDGRL